MPNYIYHDELYKARESQGIDSWDKDPEGIRHTQERFQTLLLKASVLNSSHILEIGCGAGQITQVLAPLGRRITALDISPVAIRQARRRLPEEKIEFLCENFLEPSSSLEKQRFDVVVDSHVFHCIIGEDRFLFLAKVHKLLVDGGVLILRSMCGALSLQDDSKTKVNHEKGLVYITDGQAGFFPFRQVDPAEKILSDVRASGFEIAHHELEAGTQEVLSVIARKASTSIR